MSREEFNQRVEAIGLKDSEASRRRKKTTTSYQIGPAPPELSARIHCIFHDDRSASLSVDLDAGVFHCFGCGQQGGIKRFAALVGESPTPS